MAAGSILEAIVVACTRRLGERRLRVAQGELVARVRDMPPCRSFHDALAARPFTVIGEHKRRSPSGGSMSTDNCDRAFGVYASLPWVSAVSILTEQDHFDGALSDLRRGSDVTKKPVLRKDFIFDAYQVWEARAEGADAILLMASLHVDAPERMADLYHLAREIGLDVLAEIGTGHGDPERLAAVVPGDVRIWGVNARHFSGVAAPAPGFERRDPTTDTGRHRQLRALVPEGKIAVAESGIHEAHELVEARDLGYRAALIGTAFVRGPRPIEDVARDLASAFA